MSVELSPERQAFRESWRDKIRGYIAGRVIAIAEAIAPEYDEDDCCTECGEHISGPHDPKCSRGDVELDDQADAAEWRGGQS